MSKIKSVKAECTSCGATGVYSGFCEARGEAVVCLRCSGTGCEVVRYTPFTKRRNRKGIETVSNSRGGFIATGVGAVGASISYSSFKKGEMP